MEKINFEWYRGDDETETLVFESDGEPVDFTGCSFDMDIVPEMDGSKRIRLNLSDGITVNGIAPGPTATPMMTAGDKADLGLERIPLGRYIMPEEVANMAVILVSDYGRAIMGDMIYMTGGAGNLSYDDVPYSF